MIYLLTGNKTVHITQELVGGCSGGFTLHTILTRLFWTRWSFYCTDEDDPSRQSCSSPKRANNAASCRVCVN